MSRAFLFCALEKLSFLFHLDAAVFLFCSQSPEYMGKPASSNHPKGLRRSGLGTVKPLWLVAASHPPGVPAGPGHLDSVPRSATDLLSDLRQSLPCSGRYFFLLFPSFVLPRLIVTSFGQEHCVCIKGLEQCAPDGIVQVLSRQPRGFTIQERNF